MSAVKLLLAASLFSSCSYFARDNSPIPTKDDLPQLRVKYEKYLELSKAELDNSSFTKPKCDSLLFTSLYAAAGGNVNVFQAEKLPGEWHRHPGFECYPGDSKSSISKDMFTGLLQLIWAKRDHAAIERLVDYGNAHDWLMGEAINDTERYSRTKVLGPFKATFYELRFRLGGADSDVRKIPHVWDPNLKGFERHLEILDQLLRGMMIGGINDLQLAYLKKVANDEPHNALYQAIYHKFKDGDQSRAAALLLNTKLFPEDSLPTNDNYCTEYLYQRDEFATIFHAIPCETTEGMKACVKTTSEKNPDWLPCPNKRETHNGVDFLFAAAVALGVIK